MSFSKISSDNFFNYSKQFQMGEDLWNSLINQKSQDDSFEEIINQAIVKNKQSPNSFMIIQPDEIFNYQKNIKSNPKRRKFMNKEIKKEVKKVGKKIQKQLKQRQNTNPKKQNNQKNKSNTNKRRRKESPFENFAKMFCRLLRFIVKYKINYHEINWDQYIQQQSIIEDVKKAFTDLIQHISSTDPKDGKLQMTKTYYNDYDYTFYQQILHKQIQRDQNPLKDPKQYLQKYQLVFGNLDTTIINLAKRILRQQIVKILDKHNIYRIAQRYNPKVKDINIIQEKRNLLYKYIVYNIKNLELKNKIGKIQSNKKVLQILSYFEQLSSQVQNFTQNQSQQKFIDDILQP